MSRSRSVQGSRPRTVSSPSYGTRPRIAFKAVVLPAPLGPMSPRMRPSSTRRLAPSRRDGRAVGLAQPACFYGCHGFSSPSRVHRARDLGVAPVSSSSFGLQAEALNGCVDPGPLFGQKLLPFALQQQFARAGVDEHAETAAALDELLLDQLLVALENRDRIDPILGRHVAHRRQRISFFQDALEDHVHDPVPNLSVNRLPIVPLPFHQVI